MTTESLDSKTNLAPAPPARFSPGDIVATPGALHFLGQQGVHGFSLLRRHLACDLGDLDEEDRRRNDAALDDGGRLFSSYEVGPKERCGVANRQRDRVWIITEEDRSSTTILLPEEY